MGRQLAVKSTEIFRARNNRLGQVDGAEGPPWMRSGQRRYWRFVIASNVMANSRGNVSIKARVRSDVSSWCFLQARGKAPGTRSGKGLKLVALALSFAQDHLSIAPVSFFRDSAIGSSIGPSESSVPTTRDPFGDTTYHTMPPRIRTLRILRR